MVEGPSALTSEKITGDSMIEERRRERQAAKEKRIKEVFSSPHWYYPVHKYIGDIVQG